MKDNNSVSAINASNNVNKINPKSPEMPSTNPSNKMPFNMNNAQTEEPLFDANLFSTDDKQILELISHLSETDQSIYSKFHKATRKEKALFQMFVVHFVTNKRFTDHDFNLKTAAREIGTNEKYLSTAINNCSGMSFNKVVNKYRINNAQTLINQDVLTRLNLEEIAYMSGYGNRTTFYRVFTELVGITPSRYRDNLNRGIPM